MTTHKTSFKIRHWILSLGLLFYTLNSFSQTNLATWDFAGWNPTKVEKTAAPPTFTHSNVTVSNMVKGAGITGATYFSDNAFDGTDVRAKTLTQAITNNEYFEFTITPTAGKSLTVSSIDVCALAQGQVATFSLLSSKNGFTDTKQIAAITTGAANENNIPQQTFTLTGHTEITTSLTFRVYIFAATDQQWTAFGFGLHNDAATADLIVKGSSSSPDLNPPTMPGSFAASNIGATNLKLSWTASTDDNEVSGYDVYNGTTLLGSTTTALFYNVSGLTAETNYTFKVIAKDYSGKQSAPATLSLKTAVGGTAGNVPKLPIGMNIPGLSYYTTSLAFTDAIKMSGDFMSFWDGGPWDSEKISEIPRDENGYPKQIPYATSDGKQTKARFMLNSFYKGRYVLTFDGVGTVSIGGASNQKVNSNKYYIDLDGKGDNVWLTFEQSTLNNHLKNFKLLPLIYENSSTYPTFNQKFLDGLRPFHAFRFMDWINTNDSPQKAWSDRATKTYYSQATSDRGASYEYAIELCNELDADAWVTVPHMADDNYITQAARLWRDGLRANRKVYAEYSNEIWNWQFTQAGYCLDNAPGHTNAYVIAGLNAISPAGQDHPEKDAYMIARCLRLWKAEFTGGNANRLVRVAGVQHGWMDNTRRILNFLFDVDKGGCDVVSPGGYFNFLESDHNGWLARCGTSNPVTPAEILTAVSKDYDTEEAVWTDVTAGFANDRGLGYVVYEGGQHMQPYLQGEWCYNQAVYDAQIHPKMYEMYMKNFSKMTEPTVNCSLFMAFAYMGARESRWGSWGHLENLDQIGSVSNYMTIAPKYQALLDANTPKEGTTNVAPNKTTNGELKIYPNPASGVLNLDLGSTVANAHVSIVDLQGRIILSKIISNSGFETLEVSNLRQGFYILKVASNGKVINTKFEKK